MRFRPTKTNTTFLYFLLFSILLNLGCSKDADLLLDSVIDDSEVALEEKNEITTTTETVVVSEEVVVTEQEVSSEEPEEIKIESRITSFSPTHDVHVQSGKVYNQNIIRLDQESRTSYLMFDLSPISTINGIISGATLQFTIDSDNGNGNINVFKANSSDWSENNLTETNIPQIEVQIGSILKEYKLGDTQFIDLDVTALQTENSTLILSHQNGDDLAFASKEHVSKIGPKLVVTYDVTEGTDEIIIPEPENIDEELPQEEPSLNQDPIAIADATPSTGGLPLEVNFTGSNSSDDNSIESYSWDFKDGTTATEANPTHTFSAVGSYEVVLTITDNEGLTNSESVTITVNEDPNEAPTARASASPLTGEAPLDVTFKGSTSTDDVSIVKYEWDFKDGQSGNAADLGHTYTEPGNYVAVLTVTDENGLFDKSSISITVTEPVNETPVAIATVNATSGTAPIALQFTGSNSTDDKAIVKYSWNFKDGSTSDIANPSHTFTTAGNYAVALTVEDAEGLSHTRTIGINITEPQQNQPPVAVVSANHTSGTAPLSVQFLGNSSTDDKAITNYLWDFKTGATSSSATPLYTFNQAGNYIVDLTVSDAEGASSTQSVTINVNEPVVNDTPGFYVATNGNSSNNGQSSSSPWSIEHAINMVNPGDVVFVKAGNYGNKELLFSNNNGNSGAPIKFIGYQNTPGDITSSQGSTFNVGESVNANKMPLLNSSNGTGVAITVYNRHIEFENFQINGYGTAVTTISQATNLVFRNIIVTNIGNQNVDNYDGFGFSVKGNNTLIENCFVQNTTAEAIKLFDSDNSRINYCKVYGTNATNPIDYYYLLTGGTNNTIIENSLADRAPGLRHGGHGFDLKDLAQNNTIRNCTARRTNFELNFSGVKNNVIENCFVYGVSTSPSDWHAGLVIFNGANNNLIKNMLIQDTWSAISWGDDDDGYVGPGGDRDEVSLGYDNTFENITVNNANRILNVGGGTNYDAWARRNTFKNCNFSNFVTVASTYYPTEDIRFENSSFTNGQNLVSEAQGQYAPYSSFDVSWVNCTWTNVSFNPPN